MKSLKSLCAEEVIKTCTDEDLDSLDTALPINEEVADKLRKTLKKRRDELVPTEMFSIYGNPYYHGFIGDIGITNDRKFILISTGTILLSIRADGEDIGDKDGILRDKRVYSVRYSAPLDPGCTEEYISVSPDDSYVVRVCVDHNIGGSSYLMQYITVFSTHKADDDRFKLTEINTLQGYREHQRLGEIIWTGHNHCVVTTHIIGSDKPKLLEVKINVETNEVNLIVIPTVTIERGFTTSSRYPLLSKLIGWHLRSARTEEETEEGNVVVNYLNGERRILDQEDAITVTKDFREGCVFISNELRFMISFMDKRIVIYDAIKKRVGTWDRELQGLGGIGTQGLYVHNYDLFIGVSYNFDGVLRYDIYNMRSMRRVVKQRALCENISKGFLMMGMSQDGKSHVTLYAGKRKLFDKKVIVSRLWQQI